MDRRWVAGLRAVVAGLGPEGFAAADNLLHLGGRVVVLDEDPSIAPQESELLDVLGADVRRGPGSTDALPEDAELLVVAPGWPPGESPGESPVSALVSQAHERGVGVWSDAELAWRLRDPEVPWLVVAAPDGEPGATATVLMLDAVLRAAGLRSAVVGPGGRPAVEVVMDPEPRDVLAVALATSQLRNTHTMSAQAAVVLGVDDDPRSHAALGRAYERAQVACVYDVQEPASEALVREAEVVEGARAIGVTLGTPGVGMVGVVEDLLADRAFLAERATSAAELATLADLAAPDGTPAEPVTVRHALAAAALARAHGVPQVAVRNGLRAHVRGGG